MDEEREAWVAAKKIEHYEVSNIQAAKCMRFGLFQAAPPLSIGDDGQYQKTKARIDPLGENPKEVLINPKNVITRPVKKGPAIDSTLFDKPGYTAVGDPYIQVWGTINERKEDRMIIGTILERREDRATQILNGNEKPFKPQSRVKIPVKSAYEHMSDYVPVVKNYKSEENPREVVIDFRNVITNPIKKG